MAEVGIRITQAGKTLTGGVCTSRQVVSEGDEGDLASQPEAATTEGAAESPREDFQVPTGFLPPPELVSLVEGRIFESDEDLDNAVWDLNWNGDFRLIVLCHRSRYPNAATITSSARFRDEVFGYDSIRLVFLSLDVLRGAIGSCCRFNSEVGTWKHNGIQQST